MSGLGQTQIRMVQPGPPRIGQTTIRPTTQQIIRTPAMRPLTTIRGQTTIVQTQANSQVPALHPVGTTFISSGTAQVIGTLSYCFSYPLQIISF